MLRNKTPSVFKKPRPFALWHLGLHTVSLESPSLLRFSNHVIFSLASIGNHSNIFLSNIF